MRSVSVTFRPLLTWPSQPTASHQRRRPPFKASWTRTLDDLDRELFHLRAQSIVIQLDMPESMIRNDGMPRAEARPGHPGVVLSFVSPHGPLSYPCDTYNDWRGNLRAIVLALEALRAVDRYGVTNRGEQYAGWKALPATATTTISASEAARILAAYTANRPETLLVSQANAKEAVRSAISRTHPDRNNGDRTAYDRVDAARSVLSSYHGVSL